MSCAWQTICIDFVIQNGLLMPCLPYCVKSYNNNLPLQKKIIVFENFSEVATPPQPPSPDSTAVLYICIYFLTVFLDLSF